MVDLHCHILPDLDDGARTIEEAVQMARLAVQDGICDVVATPHTYRGFFQNEPAGIEQAVQQFQQELDRQQIPLRIHPGCEVHLHPELVEHVKARRISTLGHQGRYLLVELPAYRIPAYTEAALQGLLALGITPIIAHPERHHVLRSEPRRLAGWVEQGVLAQVTAASMIGQMGRQAQRASEWMVKHQLVHVLASDAHRADRRQPLVKAAFEKVTALASTEVVLSMQANARAILQGERCEVMPSMLKERKALFSFGLRS